MQVRLVSYSQPTDEFKSLGLDDAQDLMAFCARVSNPANQYNNATSSKLIRYLIKHKHWSPLEMVSACMEITTTRDIARQILRHRSFSFQEFSQRYADPTQDLEFVTRDARLQDHSNRQNSQLLDVEHNQAHRELYAQWEERQLALIKQVRETYQWAVSSGIAKEQARAVLPEGLIESRMYMNGTLRSWVHFIELRSANGTQLEHQAVARACARVISSVFPLMTELVDQNANSC